jgi:hypothetical protein
MTKLLNGYFVEAGLAAQAELVPGSTFAPSDLKIVNGAGGVIVKRLRYDVSNPGEVGPRHATGIHFLLAVGYEAPDRVAFRDPLRKDGKPRMATLVPVTLAEGGKATQLKFDDSGADERVQLIGNVVRVTPR